MSEADDVRAGQTWRCDEAAADPDAVPDGHDSVRLWADHPRFSALVDEVVGDVAALVVGTSNSHPRAPDLGDRVDVHVDRLLAADRWSLKREGNETETPDQPVAMTDGGIDQSTSDTYQYQCPVCHCVYDDQDDAEDHVMTHPGVQPSAVVVL